MSIEKKCVDCSVIIVDEWFFGCSGYLCNKTISYNCAASKATKLLKKFPNDIRKGMKIVMDEVPGLRWFCTDCIAGMQNFKSDMVNSLKRIEKAEETLKIAINALSLSTATVEERRVTRAMSKAIVQGSAPKNLTPVVTTPMALPITALPEISVVSTISPPANGISNKLPSIVTKNSDKIVTPVAGLPSSSILNDPVNEKRDTTIQAELVRTQKLITDDFSIRVVQPRRWLFVTRVHHSVPEEQFHKLLDKITPTNNMIVQKITPKSSNGVKYDYISYKINMPEESFQAAITSKLWPDGLLVKEFEWGQKKTFFSTTPAKPQKPIMPIHKNPEHNLETVNYKNNTSMDNPQITRNQSFYFQNVNKMSSKAAQFHNFVLKTLFPVYIICETSLNKGILSSEFFPSQYVVYRCDRSPQTSSKKTGGGVLIAVHASLSNELVEISNLSIEQLCVKIIINRKSIFIYVVYVPPASSISSYVACCDTIMEINNAANPTDTILITGDFNFPSINWLYDEEMNEMLPLNVGSETECLFIDTVFDINLSQICQIHNGLDRILDLIFTNEPVMFKVNESPSPFVINDINHKAIEIILECDSNNVTNNHQNRNPYYNFRKADTINLQLYVEQINWEKELISSNIDVNVEKFYKIIFKGIALFVPTALAKPNKYPPWYDDKLINLKNKKDKAYKENLKLFSDESKHKFTACNQNFESYFELKYKSYISHMKEKIRKDPKHFWSFFLKKNVKLMVTQRV